MKNNLTHADIAKLHSISAKVNGSRPSISDGPEFDALIAAGLVRRYGRVVWLAPAGASAIAK